MKKILFFVLMFFATNSWANSETDFQGSLETRSFYYVQQDDAFVIEGIFNLKLKSFLSDKWLFKSDLEARYNSLELEQGIFVEEDEYRPYLSLEEFYFGYSMNDVDVFAGIKKINWGITDRFNPIDLINPIDLTDVIDDRKIGLPLVAINYYPGNWRIETVVAPYFIPSRLPPPSSYFYFGSDIPEEKELPKFEIENIQAGVLLAWQHKNLELIGIGYYGFDHLPFVELEILNPLVMQLNYSYEKMTAFGGGFEYAVKQLVLRGEAAYYLYPEIDEKNYAQYVLGIDYDFGQIIKTYDLYLTAQYIGETPMIKDEFWVRHLITDAASVKLLFGNDYFASSFEAVYNFPDSGLILIPSMDYKFKNNFSLHAEYNYFSGEKDSFWKFNQQNERYIFSLKYAF
jgi:hypothetical protein